MQFNQAIGLLSRPKYAEGSKLTSKRDDRNNSFLWKKGELNAGQIGSLSQAVQKLSREVAKQRRRIVGGGGGGGTGGTFRGEYDPTASYAEQDTVVIRAGSNSGSFVCIADNSAQAPQLPDIGNLYWVSLSGNVPAGGNWMS